MVFSCDCLSGCGCGTRLFIVKASKQFCNNRTSQGLSCLRISGADGSKSLPRLSEELTSNAAHRSCRSSSSSKEPFSKIAMSNFGAIGFGVMFLALNIVLALSKRRRARFTRYIRILSRIRSPASFAPGSRSALIKSPNGSIKPAAVPFAIASRFLASSDMWAGLAFPPDLTRGTLVFSGEKFASRRDAHLLRWNLWSVRVFPVFARSTPWTLTWVTAQWDNIFEGLEALDLINEAPKAHPTAAATLALPRTLTTGGRCKGRLRIRSAACSRYSRYPTRYRTRNTPNASKALAF